MNIKNMDYDIEYNKENHTAIVKLIMPVNERADAQKFILELKHNAHLKEKLIKRIEDLVDIANYDELMGEPSCAKVLNMNSMNYCDCEYCSYAHELENLIKEESI